MSPFPIPRAITFTTQGNVLKTHTLYIMLFEHIIGWATGWVEVSP